MTAAMQRRAKLARQRAVVRGWEYRQRHHSKGVWFRLRRLLVDAEVAFVIDDADAARLVADGYQPEAIGQELVPPKTILFVPEQRIASVVSRRAVPVRLNGELLAAGAIVLVRFG